MANLEELDGALPSMLGDEKIKEIIEENAKDFLGKQDDSKSEKENCAMLSTIISQVVAKALSGAYKVVANVTFSQQWGQGCKVAAKCAWDRQKDRVVTVSISNEKQICVISVFLFDFSSETEEEEYSD